MRQGFLGVQRRVIARTGTPVPGKVVRICARDGHAETGIWSSGKVSPARQDDGPIDVALLQERVTQARIRRPLPRNHRVAMDSRGNDDLPGIRVDVYGRSVSISLDSPVWPG